MAAASGVNRTQQELGHLNAWVKNNLGLDAPAEAKTAVDNASNFVVRYAGRLVSKNQTCITSVKVGVTALTAFFAFPYLAIATVAGITMNAANPTWDAKIQSFVTGVNSKVHQFGMNAGILNVKDVNGQEEVPDKAACKSKAKKLIATTAMVFATFLLAPFPIPTAIAVSVGLCLGKDLGHKFLGFRADRIEFASAVRVQTLIRARFARQAAAERSQARADDAPHFDREVVWNQDEKRYTWAV